MDKLQEQPDASLALMRLMGFRNRVTKALSATDIPKTPGEKQFCDLSVPDLVLATVASSYSWDIEGTAAWRLHQRWPLGSWLRLCCRPCRNHPLSRWPPAATQRSHSPQNTQTMDTMHGCWFTFFFGVTALLFGVTDFWSRVAIVLWNGFLPTKLPKLFDFLAWPSTGVV